MIWYLASIHNTYCMAYKYKIYKQHINKIYRDHTTERMYIDKYQCLLAISFSYLISN